MPSFDEISLAEQHEQETAESPTPAPTQVPHDLEVKSATEVEGGTSAPYIQISPSKHSAFAVFLYRFLSILFSSLLLNVVTIFVFTTGIFIAIFMFFKPSKPRPFQEAEKARRNIPVGKLTRDITHYAQTVSLDCEEHKVTTEDGFILRMQHIIDRRPQRTEAPGTPNLQTEIRKNSGYPFARTFSILGNLLCQ
jgi:Partial alpha/beta-hydrolase lipase region